MKSVPTESATFRPLTELLREAGTAGAISAAESRVVEAVLSDSQLVAFGTMAELVERAGAGTGTVARLCTKLGLTGFAELQRLAQRELLAATGPASERIKDTDPTDLLGRIAAAEQRNLAVTFERLDRDALHRASVILAKRTRHVVVLASDAANGIARQFSQEMASLRPQVEFLDGNPVSVARRLALGDATDTIVVIDVHRYDAWLVDTVQRFRSAGAAVIALTDNPRSKLAAAATIHLGFETASPGPFDSFTAALALLNVLNAETATRLKGTATARLEQLEQTWKDTKALEN